MQNSPSPPKKESEKILPSSLVSPEIQGYSCEELPKSSVEKDRHTRLSFSGTNLDGQKEGSSAGHVSTPSSGHRGRGRSTAATHVKRNIGAAFSPIKQRRHSPSLPSPGKSIEQEQVNNKQISEQQPLTALKIAEPCVMELYIPHLKRREGMVVSKRWTMKDWKDQLISLGLFNVDEDFLLLKASEYYNNNFGKDPDLPLQLDSFLHDFASDDQDAAAETFVAIKTESWKLQGQKTTVLPTTPIKMHPLSQEATAAFKDFSGLRPLILFQEDEQEEVEEDQESSSSEISVIQPHDSSDGQLSNPEDLAAFLKDRTIILESIILPGNHREGFQIFKSWTVGDWKDWIVAKNFFPTNQRHSIHVASSGADCISDEISISNLDPDLTYKIFSVCKKEVS